MPLLPRRFERLKAVLNQRMGDLTVVLEHVDKPHNLSAILRSCDAVGVLEAHVVSLAGRTPTLNCTAKGSEKWVPLHRHAEIGELLQGLKDRGLRLFGTHLSQEAVDYRQCDFTGPSPLVLGAEKWGLSAEAAALVDHVSGEFVVRGGQAAGLRAVLQREQDVGGWPRGSRSAAPRPGRRRSTPTTPRSGGRGA